MRMNRRKRQLVTGTIAESSRIQTKKFFVRENIKKQLLKEREEVSCHPIHISLIIFKLTVVFLVLIRNLRRKGQAGIE